MKKRFFTISVIITIGFWGLFSSTLAQSSEKKPVRADISDDNLMFFEKVIQKKGWEIPGLKKSVEVTGFKDQIIDNVSVTVEDIKIEKRVEVTRADYISKKPGELEIVHRNYFIQSVKQYKSKGKIFAYRVQLYFIDESAGFKQPARAVTANIYVDEDGDGKFECLYFKFN